MKIALYGISRSGKDYLIEKIVNQSNGAIKHYKGSSVLNQLSFSLYNVPFSELSSHNQQKIREEFTQMIEHSEFTDGNIIVDGHYAFPKDNGFEVVFQDSDKYLYDLFIYLNKSSHLIIDNAAKSDLKKWDSILNNIDSINQWKEFEISELKKHCLELEKELIVFDDDTSMCTNFVNDVIHHKIKLSEEVATEVSKNIIKNVKNNQVMLLDCDKTLSLNDLTNDYIESIEISLQELKDNFKGDYFTLYQFYRLHNKFVNSVQSKNQAIDYALSKIEMNNNLISNINNLSILKIGLTSGIAEAWKILNDKLHLFSHENLLIGKYDTSGYYISSFTKYLITKKIKEIGIKVYAVGDSFVDIPMLEIADHGWLVVLKKTSSPVQNYINRTPLTRIHQICYSNIRYLGIPEDDKVWLK